MDTFAELMASELRRINDERAALHAQLTEIEAGLKALDRELVAIEAYEKAKAGKPTRTTNGAAKRIRSGSKREAIIAVVTANPQGVSRGELLEVMGLRGDKSGEMSVSNALTALSKNNTLMRTLDGKKYVLAV